jgi:hypothetical protein
LIEREVRKREAENVIEARWAEMCLTEEVEGFFEGAACQATRKGWFVVAVCENRS